MVLYRCTAGGNPLAFIVPDFSSPMNPTGGLNVMTFDAVHTGSNNIIFNFLDGQVRVSFVCSNEFISRPVTDSPATADKKLQLELPTTDERLPL